MRFSVVDFPVGFAKRADFCFDIFDQPKGRASLFFSCAAAEEAFEALAGHFALSFADGLSVHGYCRLLYSASADDLL